MFKLTKKRHQNDAIGLNSKRSTDLRTVSGQGSHFISPENTRKTKSFLVVSGGMK